MFVGESLLNKCKWKTRKLYSDTQRFETVSNCLSSGWKFELLNCSNWNHLTAFSVLCHGIAFGSMPHLAYPTVLVILWDVWRQLQQYASCNIVYRHEVLLFICTSKTAQRRSTDGFVNAPTKADDGRNCE